MMFTALLFGMASMPVSAAALYAGDHQQQESVQQDEKKAPSSDKATEEPAEEDSGLLVEVVNGMGDVLNEVGAGIDQQQHSLSEHLVDFSEQIDTFFITDDQERRMNYTHIQFGYRYIQYQAGNHRLEPVLESRVHLPRMENYLSLEMSNMNPLGVSDDAATAAAAPGGSGTANQDVPGQTEQPFSMALGYARDLSEYLSAKLTGGGKWSNNRVNPYINLRLARKIYFQNWGLTLSEDLYHDSIIHSRATTQMLFERKIDEDKVFQSLTQNIYYFDLGYTQNHQTFSLMHQLSDRDALIYQVGGMWEKPLNVLDYKLENAYTLLRYSRRIHKDWLFFEISPQVHFPRTGNYNPQPLLLLQLTALLGKK